MPSVLIVDDHPSFRANARALLEAEGYDVVGEADSATAAIAAAHELRPDVVLLDIQLPDGSGLDIAARLRSNGHAPRVILVSSRDRADYGRLIDESGALGFIAKGELSGAALADVLE